MGEQVLEAATGTPWVPASQVVATYRRISLDVARLNERELRWTWRRAARRATSDNPHDLAMVRAIEHEFGHRGLQVPAS